MLKSTNAVGRARPGFDIVAPSTGGLPLPPPEDASLGGRLKRGATAGGDEEDAPLVAFPLAHVLAVQALLLNRLLLRRAALLLPLPLESSLRLSRAALLSRESTRTRWLLLFNYPSAASDLPPSLQLVACCQLVSPSTCVQNVRSDPAKV